MNGHVVNSHVVNGHVVSGHVVSGHEPDSDDNISNTTPMEPNADIDLQSVSLGAYAHQLMAHNYRKFIKHEASVLKDNDPEALHQMRVGIRRLRTSLECFDQVLDWPKTASDKRLKRIAKTLGHLRDLDVLQATLQERYVPYLSPEEQDPMGKVMATLTRKRAKQLRNVRKLLQSKAYKVVKRSIEKWLKHPKYQSAIAGLPMQMVLPDLVTPLISDLLLHPGWLFETNLQAGELKFNSITPANVNQLLDQKGELLHSLRRQMKRVRYQTEFFKQFFSKKANDYLQEFKTMQDQLGQLQDCSVLQSFLRRCLKNWPAKLKNVHQQIQQDEAAAWIEWRSQQFHYLNADLRHHLRTTLLTNPTSFGQSEPCSPLENQPELLPVLPVG